MKKTNTQRLITIFSLFASAACAPAFAVEKEQKWYQVELIVFANSKPEEAYTESWPEAPGTSNVENKVDLETTKANSTIETQEPRAQPLPIIVPFSTVAENEFKLKVSADKLKNSPNYDLLLHIGWRQPVFSAKEKSAVYIHDGLNRTSLLTTKKENTTIEKPRALEQMRGIDNLVPGGPDAQRFFGALKLSLSRFLHIDIDMVYRDFIKSNTRNSTETLTPVTENNSSNNDENNQIQSSPFQEETLNEPDMLIPRDFRLVTSRRVKPDEIHYFDHPKFGIITMVTRYEIPNPEDEEATLQPFIP